MNLRISALILDLLIPAETLNSEIQFILYSKKFMQVMLKLQNIILI